MISALTQLAAPAADALQGALAPPNLAAAQLPSGLGSALWLLAIPLLLAAIALALRGRPQAQRHMKILETQGLGGRRNLVLLQLDGESLLLASSEAGISLLATRPARQGVQPAPRDSAQSLRTESQALREGAYAQGPALSLLPQPKPHPSLASNWLSRAVGRITPQKQASPPFAPVLEETIDDQELRRKLGAGRSGRVP